MYFLKKQEIATKISTYLALFFIGLFMISLIAFGQELININRASKTKLETLPGIGPAYAQRIIDGRPYHAEEELLEVKGIGEKTFEDIKDLVTIGSGPTAIFKPENAPSPVNKNSNSDAIHKVSEENPVDINHASQKQLQLLPGIGPVYSERIMNQRPFLDKNDLLDVKGIGKKTLEGLKPLIIINSQEKASAVHPVKKGNSLGKFEEKLILNTVEPTTATATERKSIVTVVIQRLFQRTCLTFRF